MNRLICFAMTGALAVGGVSLVGCQSENNNPPPQSNSDNSYEGGNGAFGESPANPGEHSQQHFEKSTGVNPTTQPSGSYQNQ